MRGLRRRLKEGRFTAYFMRDRRWVALSICLLISVFFWIVAAIDDPRGYTKEVAVQLDKPILPTNYRMTDLSQYPEVVYVKVHAKGGALRGIPSIRSVDPPIECALLWILLSCYLRAVSID